MTRHIGAFILNTVIPVIDRLEKLLEKHPDALDKIDILVQMEIDKVKVYCMTICLLTAMVSAVILTVAGK
ncbi:MAG TPA: hypothetical protein P5110_09620 [Candidatus Omnitrophota bacterium]|nr:hypothetical protein [Candidatus Omnitrophota bacterium]